PSCPANRAGRSRSSRGFQSPECVAQRRGPLEILAGHRIGEFRPDPGALQLKPESLVLALPGAQAGRSVMNPGTVEAADQFQQQWLEGDPAGGTTQPPGGAVVVQRCAASATRGQLEVGCGPACQQVAAGSERVPRGPIEEIRLDASIGGAFVTQVQGHREAVARQGEMDDRVALVTLLAAGHGSIPAAWNSWRCPAAMVITRSAIAASSRLWVTATNAVPERRTWSTSSWCRCSAVGGSRLPVGSSASSTAGL